MQPFPVMWKPTFVVLAAVVLAAVVGPDGEVRAQDAVPKLDAEVNYVYAAQFGFGGYSIGGLSVQVYSLPIEFTVPDLVMDWDLRIGLPIIYGRYEVSGESEGYRVSASTNTSCNSTFRSSRASASRQSERWGSPGRSGALSTFDSTGSRSTASRSTKTRSSRTRSVSPASIRESSIG